MPDESPSRGQSSPFLTPESLQKMFWGGFRWLDANAEGVNILNVFPVPDGDTGTNMALTLKAGLDTMERSGRTDLVAAAKALADGALLGARGNSGVILSQWLAGLAVAIDRGLKPALDSASECAYHAVSQPVEGTMLTVMREAALAARGDVPENVVATALDGARAALAATPELLPVLREAGVVDAGGQGIVLILEGALAGLQGTDLGPARHLGQIDATWLAGAHQAVSGYCTEFILRGASRRPEELQATFGSLGDSVLVVGELGMVRVHLHTADPGAALSLAAGQGTLHRIKIDNMAEQQENLAGIAPQVGGDHLLVSRRPAARVPIVAVAPGEGLARIFESLGAVVVPGGQTMNPSAGELLRAAMEVDGPGVIILPNNGNIIPAAEQAAAVAPKPIRVVPTRSVPQGLAALLTYNAELPIEDNLAPMSAQLEAVLTLEVTQAVRDATIEGLRIEQGRYLALVDGQPKATGSTPGQAVDAALDALELNGSYLVTLYYGAMVSRDEADALGQALRERPDTPEIEILWGGQPHYAYLASVER